MIYCFDIDGTICSLEEDSNYMDAKPFEGVRRRINQLYEEGNTILFMTARGSVSGRDWTIQTTRQLDGWGFKYHELITNKKPHADIFIDDKCIHIDDWRGEFTPVKKGFIAGSFDIIHPGYIRCFKDASEHCNHLVVGLHVDPTRERSEKLKPVLSVSERREMLLSLRHVNEIFEYETEEELYDYLSENHIDVRFLGEDYKGRNYTGSDLQHPIVFISRNHGWSSTKLKKKVFNSMKGGEQVEEDGVRPWGEYHVLYDGEECKVKKIIVRPGHKLSLQSHEHRKETWVVVQGSGTVEKDNVCNEEPLQLFCLKPGDNTVIEKKEKHRIENRGKEDLVFIEVQTGEYFGEDDIVRYEDSYGRA